MRPQIDVHLAVTFVKFPPDREDEPGRAAGATSQTPIQHFAGSADPSGVIQVEGPKGSVPRFDLFLTVGTAEGSGPRPAGNPEPQTSKHDS